MTGIVVANCSLAGAAVPGSSMDFFFTATLRDAAGFTVSTSREKKLKDIRTFLH